MLILLPRQGCNGCMAPSVHLLLATRGVHLYVDELVQVAELVKELTLV